MIIILLIAIIVCFVLCYLWVKFVFAIFSPKIWNRKKLKEDSNPYIKAQKLINANHKNYDDYLIWMQNNGGGIPLDKVMTREEFEGDAEIKKLIA